ncbi:MAG TPA: pyridoxal-dependent decarboxylase [Bryobacteraceae bacterium]|nr:pyridoxal-dependent decarboxylase [Bryobacteraceae bacterium]
MTRDMSAEELRDRGRQVFNWIAEYLEDLRSLPVLPSVKPGDVRRMLPASAPDEGEPFDQIFADFEQILVPATTHWNHPRFHAYFSVSSSAPGILAEALSAAINTNGMVWKASPASTELELLVADWLRQWLDLPEQFFGIIHDTASSSTMHALAAARQYADPESRTRGLRGDLTVYTSEQAHSSVEKGAIAIGLGQDNVRKIGVDAAFQMRMDLLRQAIEADVAAGKRPCCVIPTVGTTSTTSIDNVQDAVDIAARHNIWVHVDAAYGGCAAVLPELRHIMNGSERAHSIVVNPHKWLFTPIDASLLYTSRPDVLRDAFSLVPEYLTTRDHTGTVNMMDYGVPLGRRFRALKLWFVMRSLGRKNISDTIRDHLGYAQEMARRLRADSRFEVCAPVPLSLVCFRLRGSDEQNQQLLDRINLSGDAFLSHTVLNGQYVLRLAYGNLRTLPEDIDIVWKRIQAEVETL